MTMSACAIFSRLELYSSKSLISLSSERCNPLAIVFSASVRCVSSLTNAGSDSANNANNPIANKRLYLKLELAAIASSCLCKSAS